MGVSAARPIIGLTSYRERAVMGPFDTMAVFLPTSYGDAIVRAGGSIVVLPPQEPEAASVARILDGLDGLSISGGYDVDPAVYGHSAHPTTDEPRQDRDAWELALLAGAVARDMPILGVCRGAQVLNVLRGGTLHQHLPDVVGTTRHQGADGVFSSVPVATVPGTMLDDVHPVDRTVPVYHHQAIDTLGEGLVAAAWSEDGVIEAIEEPSLTFCIAAQWHPEQDPGSAPLYAAFVAAAHAYRGAQRAPA